MSSRCVHKDENGEQCPLMAETGLFCETHTAAENKAAARPKAGGGGGGGGRSMFRESIFKKMGVVYHHEPEDKKDYLG
jgi:hypothetical protein